MARKSSYEVKVCDMKELPVKLDCLGSRVVLSVLPDIWGDPEMNNQARLKISQCHQESKVIAHFLEPEPNGGAAPVRSAGTS